MDYRDDLFLSAPSYARDQKAGQYIREVEQPEKEGGKREEKQEGSEGLED